MVNYFDNNHNNNDIDKGQHKIEEDGEEVRRLSNNPIFHSRSSLDFKPSSMPSSMSHQTKPIHQNRFSMVNRNALPTSSFNSNVMDDGLHSSTSTTTTTSSSSNNNHHIATLDEGDGVELQNNQEVRERRISNSLVFRNSATFNQLSSNKRGSGGSVGSGGNHRTMRSLSSTITPTIGFNHQNTINMRTMRSSSTITNTLPTLNNSSLSSHIDPHTNIKIDDDVDEKVPTNNMTLAFTAKLPTSTGSLTGNHPTGRSLEDTLGRFSEI
eukprot:CAMPEP_0114345188 /NCGR_PEP_ID=MMETSP0101-20121206/12021_1 /TAXON_ID=38822 ORGANISM="Pteridomonas danica, Strain PT" /NCGR_SAMPLE_ID=MMETSP0101 /ASSEMBLY_ACC=CAM_ASM_000211 /LENGTH=267 /DNA_ID=CAMNT_0001480989 /DNA_START=132 /DNA_END=935 /DNA_ORIENTATION=+